MRSRRDLPPLRQNIAADSRTAAEQVPLCGGVAACRRGGLSPEALAKGGLSPEASAKSGLSRVTKTGHSPRFTE